LSASVFGWIRARAASATARALGQRVNSGLRTTGGFLRRAVMAPVRLGAGRVAAIQQARGNAAANRSTAQQWGARAMHQDARAMIRAARENQAAGQANIQGGQENIAAGQDRIAAARAGTGFLTRLNPFSRVGAAARAQIREGRAQIREGRAMIRQGNGEIRTSGQLARQGLATRQVAAQARRASAAEYDRALRLDQSASRMRAVANGQ
jgi:hypothetical protein